MGAAIREKFEAAAALSDLYAVQLSILDASTKAEVSMFASAIADKTHFEISTILERFRDSQVKASSTSSDLDAMSASTDGPGGSCASRACSVSFNGAPAGT